MSVLGVIIHYHVDEARNNIDLFYFYLHRMKRKLSDFNC